MTKYAIVTGGSSGLGKSLVQLMADSGYHVFAMSRNIDPIPHERITAIRCDITDESSIQQALGLIRQTTQELDVLANCAGFGISGPIETTPLELAKRQFEVNFFGTFNITKAAIDMLRPRKGRIFTISSVAATIPIPFQSFYSSTKSALTSWSLCLDNELKPFGIRAIAVEPGDLSTGFTDNRIHVQTNDLYRERVTGSVSRMEADESSGKSSSDAARYFLKLIEKSNPAPLYVMGMDYKLFTLLYRLVPYRFSNYLIGRLYAR